MANGIKVPGRWVPGTVAGVVVDSRYVKGGYITVSSVKERDALFQPGCEVLTPGTKVFVQEENTEYIYAETVTGQKEFQNTIDNTVDALLSKEFVQKDQVTAIVRDESKTMVEEAVNETVPGIVEKEVESSLQGITEDITQKATDAATEAAVKQIDASYVQKDDLNKQLDTTIEPIQTDVSDLKQKSQEADEKIGQNTANITNVTNQVTTLNSNLTENYYSKSDIDAKISGIYHYKGSVDTFDDLPKNAQVGDVYNVNSTGMNYAWTGEIWDELGTLFEADNYYTKEDTNNQISAKLEGYTSTEDLNQELDLKADKASLESLASKDDVSNQIKEVKDSLASDLAYGEF